MVTEVVVIMYSKEVLIKHDTKLRILISRDLWFSWDGLMCASALVNKEDIFIGEEGDTNQLESRIICFFYTTPFMSRFSIFSYKKGWEGGSEWEMWRPNLTWIEWRDLNFSPNPINSLKTQPVVLYFPLIFVDFSTQIETGITFHSRVGSSITHNFRQQTENRKKPSWDHIIWDAGFITSFN